MKDSKYYKDNAEEDYIKTPISVLRYITELEKVKQNKILILYGVMQRFLAQTLLIIFCYVLIKYILKIDSTIIPIHAICWSGNIFWLRKYTNWFYNVA